MTAPREPIGEMCTFSDFLFSFSLFWVTASLHTCIFARYESFGTPADALFNLHQEKLFWRLSENKRRWRPYCGSGVGMNFNGIRAEERAPLPMTLRKLCVCPLEVPPPAPRPPPPTYTPENCANLSSLNTWRPTYLAGSRRYWRDSAWSEEQHILGPQPRVVILTVQTKAYCSQRYRFLTYV